MSGFSVIIASIYKEWQIMFIRVIIASVYTEGGYE